MISRTPIYLPFATSIDNHKARIVGHAEFGGQVSPGLSLQVHEQPDVAVRKQPVELLVPKNSRLIKVTASFG
jgi:hypothetical protein